MFSLKAVARSLVGPAPYSMFSCHSYNVRPPSEGEGQVGLGEASKIVQLYVADPENPSASIPTQILRVGTSIELFEVIYIMNASGETVDVVRA